MSKLLFTIDTIAAPDSFAMLLQKIVQGRVGDGDITSLQLLGRNVEYHGVVTDLSAPRQGNGAPDQDLEANHAQRSQPHSNDHPVKALRIFRVEEDGRVMSYDVQHLVEKLERGSLEEFLDDVFGGPVDDHIPE